MSEQEEKEEQMDEYVSFAVEAFVSDDSVEEYVVAGSFCRLKPNLELQNDVAISCSANNKQKSQTPIVHKSASASYCL